MYFLMATNEDPFLSLRAPIAACTITDVGGKEDFTLGFFAFAALAGLAGAGFSAILDILLV